MSEASALGTPRRTFKEVSPFPVVTTFAVTNADNQSVLIPGKAKQAWIQVVESTSKMWFNFGANTAAGTRGHVLFDVSGVSVIVDVGHARGQRVHFYDGSSSSMVTLTYWI